MVLQDFLAKFYGATVHQDELALNTTIQTTFTQICANDPSRIHFFVSNTGGHDIFIYPDETVSTTKGILVPANGGLITFKQPDHGALTSSQWFAVGSGGTSTITFGSTRLL